MKRKGAASGLSGTDAKNILFCYEENKVFCFLLHSKMFGKPSAVNLTEKRTIFMHSSCCLHWLVTILSKINLKNTIK
jgi:hypothetical protein